MREQSCCQRVANEKGREEKSGISSLVLMELTIVSVGDSFYLKESRFKKTSQKNGIRQARVAGSTEKPEEILKQEGLGTCR